MKKLYFLLAFIGIGKTLVAQQPYTPLPPYVSAPPRYIRSGYPIPLHLVQVRLQTILA